MTYVVPDPTPPPIGKDNFTMASTYIINNAPGYQIEYSTVTNEDIQLIVDLDCKVYGMPWAALLICVKNVGTGLIGGTQNLYPGKLAKISCECMSN
jgi:hypothetical protein